MSRLVETMALRFLEIEEDTQSLTVEIDLEASEKAAVMEALGPGSIFFACGDPANNLVCFERRDRVRLHEIALQLPHGFEVGTGPHLISLAYWQSDIDDIRLIPELGNLVIPFSSPDKKTIRFVEGGIALTPPDLAVGERYGIVLGMSQLNVSMRGAVPFDPPYSGWSPGESISFGYSLTITHTAPAVEKPAP